MKIGSVVLFPAASCLQLLTSHRVIQCHAVHKPTTGLRKANQPKHLVSVVQCLCLITAQCCTSHFQILQLLRPVRDTSSNRRYFRFCHVSILAFRFLRRAVLREFLGERDEFNRTWEVFPERFRYFESLGYRQSRSLNCSWDLTSSVWKFSSKQQRALSVAHKVQFSA